MALVFRWYLGKSSRWANSGADDRQVDYQIWCGPAMGAFNEWARGSFLENPDCREFETVAMNLLFGACVVMRRLRIANDLAAANMNLPADIGKFTPMSIEKINEILINT